MFNMSQQEIRLIRAKRSKIDGIYKIVTVLASLMGVLSLVGIIAYVLVKGSTLLTLNLLTGDYYETTYHLTHKEVLNFCNCTNNSEEFEDMFYSSKWGIGFKDTLDIEGHSVVSIEYIDEASTIYQLYDEYSDEDNLDASTIFEGMEVNSINFGSGTIIVGSKGAQTLIETLDNSDSIRELYISSEGGGIRGSLISTLYLILISLVFAVPIGIFTAIYLNEYAKKSFFTNQLRRLIEMLTGVPSIIFGMVGVLVFIRVTSAFGIEGRNLIAAGMTLAVIILPIIIRSTEESLRIIPKDLRQASLALGANQTQTTFQIVLPNALPGILTAVLLGIGRVIGESAALIFVLGTTINDQVSLTGSATTLSVQIWTVMGGEVANFELASAISIIILLVVLILNLTVKLIVYRLNQAWR